MKRGIYALITALLLINVHTVAAKEIKNPHYEFRNSAIPKITKIELTDTETILHIRCTFKPNWWINIDDRITIKNSNGDQSYTVKSMEGGEFNEKLVTPECGYQDIALHFDAIDKEITSIDFIEADGWQIYGIDLTGTKSDNWNSELPKELHGNWSDKSGLKGWCYGLYEDFAVVDNLFWEYQSVKKHKGGYRLELAENGNKKTLFIKVNDGTLAIDETPNPTSLYTSDTPRYNTRGIATSDIDPLKRGTMLLNGYIEGYSPRSGLTTGMVYSSDNITRGTQQSLITIEEDGRFSAKIDVAQANDCFIRFGDFHISIYATAGDTLTLYLSQEGMLQQQILGSYTMPSDTRAMGEMSRLNIELGELTNDTRITLAQSRKLNNWRNKLGAEAYRDSTMMFYSIDSAALEQLLAKKNYTPATKKIARTSLRANFFDLLITFFWAHRGERIEEEVSPGIIRSSSEISNKLPASYFDILKGIDVGDKTALLLSDFSVFINRYEFAPFFGSYLSTFNYNEALMRLINARVISADEKIQKTLAIVDANNRARKEGNLEAIIDIDSLSNVEWRQFIQEKAPLINSLFADSLVLIPARAQMEEKIAKGQELWGDDADLLTQIVITREFGYRTTMLKAEQAQQYKEMLFEYITEPHIKVLINDLYNKKYGIVTTKAASRPIPEGAGKAEIEKLLAPHKGKYVMVDFWAAGCGPCISGINSSHDLRKRLANEPIVFMFVTDQRSTPLEAYNKYMSPTTGDKHRITTDEWNKIASLFNINGIPRYILFDKEGQIIT